MLKYRLKNALLFSLVVLAVVSACHKDNVSSKPTLLSFGPSTVDHGDTIKFIGTNLNQITDIIMPVGIDVPSSSFLTHTSTLIELVVPDLSMMGHVVLKFGNNDSIVSKALFGAAYTITVRSFTPASLRPGDNVTINGNFLNYVKQVSFNAGQDVTQFVSQSLHQLVVQVPLAAQTGPFTLTDLASTSPQVVTQDTLLSDLILTVALPTATSISPTAQVQNKDITITGTDLDLVTEIDFPSSAGIEQKASGVVTTTPGTAQVLSTSFKSQTTTQIVVTVPVTAVTGALTLVAPSGLKTTSPSVTVLEPTVTTMSTGKAGVDNVTISGTSLDLVKSITFPGSSTAVAATSFVSQSATQIEVAIPASAIPGNLTLTTTTDFPVVIDGYTITLPEATAYSSTNAGQPATITGTDLDLVTSMKFPDGTVVQQSDFTAQSATSITVDVPSTSTSAGTLTFIIANGYNVPQTLGFGGCSTSFPGTLLFDFADASQVTVWNLAGNAATTSNWDNTGGNTCNGELTVAATVTSAGTTFQYDIGNVDWSGKTKLHMWVKIETDISTINGGQIFAQPNWGWVAQWANASPTFDGQWHELVLPIDASFNPVDRIGFQILATSGAGTASITLHIDDVWVE